MKIDEKQQHTRIHISCVQVSQFSFYDENRKKMKFMMEHNEKVQFLTSKIETTIEFSNHH